MSKRTIPEKRSALGDVSARGASHARSDERLNVDVGIGSKPAGRKPGGWDPKGLKFRGQPRDGKIEEGVRRHGLRVHAPGAFFISAGRRQQQYGARGIVGM